MVYLKTLKKPALQKPAERRPVLFSVTAFLIAVLFFGTIFGLFLQSVFDTDKTISESENRTLASMPHLSLQALSDGSFMTDFEAYYADTFPRREQFLAINQKIDAFFTGTRGSDDIVLVEKGNKDDFAGQDIDYDE